MTLLFVGYCITKFKHIQFAAEYCNKLQIQTYISAPKFCFQTPTRYSIVNKFLLLKSLFKIPANMSGMIEKFAHMTPVQ